MLERGKGVYCRVMEGGEQKGPNSRGNSSPLSLRRLSKLLLSNALLLLSSAVDSSLERKGGRLCLQKRKWKPNEAIECETEEGRDCHFDRYHFSGRRCRRRV